ncbi:MAG: prolipoprotein diacylglyceryl transferase [Candidatus Omnitrophica bacterium]|nr:prolipoprotein diacylglyceryl transferase [Candidatus Omnitrophota bacterium]
MHPILCKIGPFTIYTYGFCVFLGVLAGYAIASKEAKRVGIKYDDFSDIFFWSLIFSFLGARLLYILVEFKDFLTNPLNMIFARAGFVFFGGVVGGLTTIYLLTRRKNINFLKYSDIIILGVPLGHAFGRIGCFFYGCCYGKLEAVFPIQLISACGLFVIFVTFWILRRRKKFDGALVFAYLITYGLFRFIIEFFRQDPRGYVEFLSTSQIFSIFSIIAGAFLYFKNSRKHY